jgi:hypothetical protein
VGFVTAEYVQNRDEEVFNDVSRGKNLPRVI